MMSQDALELGQTAPVMVSAMQPPMCALVSQGGVEMDVKSLTVLDLQTVTTEECVTPHWIHHSVWTASRAGWARPVRSHVNMGTRSPPIVECVNVTPVSQVKAVTVSVMDTVTAWRTGVCVMWPGGAPCVRYRAVPASLRTAPSTAPVTAPPKCAPVIQVGQEVTVIPRTVQEDVLGRDTVMESTEMSQSVSVKTDGWERTAPSPASTVRWMEPPVSVTLVTRGQDVNWSVPAMVNVSTRHVTAILQ